jgi:hypothetical protein
MSGRRKVVEHKVVGRGVTDFFKGYLGISTDKGHGDGTLKQ